MTAPEIFLFAWIMSRVPVIITGLHAIVTAISVIAAELSRITIHSPCVASISNTITSAHWIIASSHLQSALRLPLLLWRESPLLSPHADRVYR
jgi:hypothetical protein